MKTVLAILGACFVAVTLLLAACAVPVFTRGVSLDRESRAYTAQVLRAVVSEWDQSALESEASPEFREATSDEIVDKLFRAYRRMGKLESLGELEGGSRVMKYVGQETQITATYQCEAEFENGPASIGVTVIKHGDTWQVAGFNLNSEVFLDEP